MLIRKFLSIFCLLTISSACWPADTLLVRSPSGEICVKVWMERQLKYSISYHDRSILLPSSIDMLLVNKQDLSYNNAIRSAKVKKINEQIISPIPEKRKIIPDIYSLLSVSFRRPYIVEFRVYDDGVAYRIITLFKDSIYVENEVAEFSFPGKPSAYFPEVQKRPDADIFHTSFEQEYLLRSLDTIPIGAVAYNPVLVVPDRNPKIAITESDLEDYPGMFLEGTGSSVLKGIFAGYPLEEQATEGLYRQNKVTGRAPFLAKTSGSRRFPWRVLIIAEEDKDLPSNDLVYRLASPSGIQDVSWIKPGNLTDEWIIDLNLFNVPFRAGLNTASYKYYIDFAKRFGFDRIMMDAGWSDRVTPGHDVTLAFTRMLAGGFDYEPGLLNNATIKGTRPISGVVTSPGTRCHQLSMFVIYDSPMQIFSGNPSEGMLEPQFMNLLGNIPTTWDETVIIDAKVGEYIVTARLKDNNWFVAGMTDWSEREIIIKFGFLDDGIYKATICRDGINADRYAADYVIEEDLHIRKNDETKIHLAPGGGFLIRLDRF